MELKDRLLQYYEMFSKKMSGHVCKVSGELDTFISILEKTDDLTLLGNWFAFYYIAYQFEYYRGMKTRMNGKFPANWIFGKKALERWKNRDMDNWLFFVQKFLGESEIAIPVDFYSDSMDGYYEQERRRFLNTDIGLLHCLQSARYSDKSSACLICKNKRDCKELWK